jgi:hypothetical protein
MPQGAGAPAVEASRGTPPPTQGSTAPQASGLPGPIPQGDTASRPAAVSLQQAESLAQANDIRRCRDTAQQMRRAGVALPPALIALAGLRLELLERKGP